MILYVNGDSHAAAAESVNPYAFAEDDPSFFYMGRIPHPENKAVAWSTILAKTLKAYLHLDAESASSNQRILRTSRDWLDSHHSPEHSLVVIQWSTWEREEWIIDDCLYQITASGTDMLPESHQSRYKSWIAEIDWQDRMRYWHEQIWQFHQELETRNIRHVFFNGNSHFEDIPKTHRKNWEASFIDPYDPKMTYNQWLLSHGYQTVSPNSWHFGKDAHAGWARFMLQYIVQNNFVPK